MMEVNLTAAAMNWHYSYVLAYTKFSILESVSEAGTGYRRILNLAIGNTSVLNLVQVQYRVRP